MRAILPALVSVLAMATGCGQAAGDVPGPERAQVVFADNCAKCHGADAHGNRDIAAPAIAGLPDWYIERQLHNYRKGIRGAHGDDVEGMRMRPMSRTLPTSDFKPLATYVSGLTPVPEMASHLGDPDVGQQHYAACSACHGTDGKGNKALNAPPIGQLQSWYIETQLHKFRNGIRGAHPDDTYGAQMRPMSMAIPDDQAVTDLSAYVSTL
jgi:cytochrome c oxidase subunit 2